MCEPHLLCYNESDVRRYFAHLLEDKLVGFVFRGVCIGGCLWVKMDKRSLEKKKNL